MVIAKIVGMLGSSVRTSAASKNTLRRSKIRVIRRATFYAKHKISESLNPDGKKSFKSVSSVGEKNREAIKKFRVIRGFRER
jgi:hypothetical protein